MAFEIHTFFIPETDKSRNYDYRPQYTTIDKVVLNYGGGTIRDLIMKFTEPVGNPAGVSMHYVIDTDGGIFQFVPDDKRAWHAGESSWVDEDNINNTSIGITLANGGSLQRVSYSGLPKLVWHTKQFYTPQQMTSLVALLDHLKIEHPDIKDRNIIGHSDVTAWNARKFGPGITFDWKELSDRGHGLYPDPFPATEVRMPGETIYKLGDQDPGVEAFKEKLHRYGYKITVDEKFDTETANVVRAFNMHFYNDPTFEYPSHDYTHYENWMVGSEVSLDSLLSKIGPVDM